MDLPQAAAFWLPAGYDGCVAPEAALAPPGSLAEFQLRTGLSGPAALHAFAGQFPGLEAEIEAYENEWAACFVKTVWPILRRHANSPLRWQLAAEELASDPNLQACFRSSLLRLQRSIVAANDDPQIRDRLQDLLFIHGVQSLRAQTIGRVASTGDPEAGGQLVRMSEELPAESRFGPWLRAQEDAERQVGDLAGRELYRLCRGEPGATPIQAQGFLVLPDPADSGRAATWEEHWPTSLAGQPLGTPFPAWLGQQTAGQASRVAWFLGRFQTEANPPGEIVLHVRSARGQVCAYLDGRLVGEYQEAPDRPLSCRFPLAFGEPGRRSHTLVLRIAAPAGAEDTPILWHEPRLLAVPASPLPPR